MRSLLKGIVLSLAYIIGLCAVFPANASSIDQGVSWLQAQSQPSNGSYSTSADIALPEQSTSEALTVFHSLKQPVDTAQTRALDFLNASPDNSAETVARRIIANAQQEKPTAALVATLKSYQNADGGFGFEQWYESSVLDTTWALKALAAVGQLNGSETQRALTWLLSQQKADGRWDGMEGGFDLAATAQAMEAVWLYRKTFNINANLTRAQNGLMAQQSAGHWGNVLNNAHALRAVLLMLPDTNSVQTALTVLSDAQSANGSWEGDAYVTALVLQVLGATSRPSPNPDHASITGTIVDNDTGLPIENVPVRLARTNLTINTDAQGRFTFTHLNAGAEQLSVEATGYRPLSAPLNLQTGQDLDLGELRLIAGVSNDVTITGVAHYYHSVAGIIYVASGASIKAGTQIVSADGSGAYTLTGLPAGQIELEASYYNYPIIRASFTAKAGEVINLDLLFKQTSSAGSVKFIVTDAQTGSPLSGVTIALDPVGTTVNVTTNAQGVATHSNSLALGENFFEVWHYGYEIALIKIDLKGWQDIEVPVSLVPYTGTGAVLKGTVADTDTGLPLAGVSVQVPTWSLETQTNAQGEYEFTGITLSRDDIIFSKAGYEPATYRIFVYNNWFTVFNVGLTALTGTQPESSLKVTVTDRATNLPIHGAEIVLSGATTATILSGADGVATVNVLSLGDTRAQINAVGYQSVFASFNVKPGQAYELPAGLLPEANIHPSLYGVVLDNITKQPVSGAVLLLSGAHTATATSNARGYYEFTDVARGEVMLHIQHGGYEAMTYSLSIENTTEVNAMLSPKWSGSATVPFEIFGTVVDAVSLEPIHGAAILLQEVILGATVLAEQRGYSQSNGDFLFEGLAESHARLMVSMTGYDMVVFPFVRERAQSQYLGTIMLNRSYNAALPDLQLREADRSLLVVDPNTFEANGTVSVKVVNNSNYDAGAFNVIAFVDTNHNEAWDAGVDVLLFRQRMDALSGQQERAMTFSIDGALLPFRDAPIYLMVDSDLEVIETIEGNNTLRVSPSCSVGGGFQDVAVCIDTSGSVSHLYDLEMEGVIKAVENPNIIPHDGSIRFTLGTDLEMYYGPFIPLHQAVVVTPATLQQLLDDLKNKRVTGGYSSGPKCALMLSEYLKTLSPQGSSKTLVLVGDGYWEGIPATQSQLPQTVANGVSRIDVIGIGWANVPELEANAWPKPVNSLHGGKVTLANTSGEIAAAMARALADSIRSVDLTLGNLRLIDKGAGQPVTLATRIGNAGSLSQAANVRFYQSGTLLGEVPVAALKTGAFADLVLNNVSLVSDDPIEAIVDENRINAECNIANNRLQISVAAANRLASLNVSTDQPAYPPQTAVLFDALSRNLGAFPAGFKVRLSVLDADDIVVETFAETDLGMLISNGMVEHQQHWNTARYVAGSYVLHGELFDTDGNIVASDRAFFAILSIARGQLSASLRVAPDQIEYTSNDLVMLDSLANNLSLNTAIESARVTLTVRDPSNNIVFSHAEALGDVVARGTRRFETPQRLISAPLGHYTIEARLEDKNSVTLAQASSGYIVKAAVPIGAGIIDGSVALAHPVVVQGDPQSRSDTVENTGGASLDNVTIARVLLRNSDGAEISRVQNTVTLAVGESRSWPLVNIPTGALTPGGYTAILAVDDNGTWETIDSAGFTVTAVGTTSGNLQHIPTLTPPLLLLLLLMLVGVAWKRTFSPLSPRGRGAGGEGDKLSAHTTRESHHRGERP
ncbi:MAG: carboxypeptidase regulatory-like domain-containing protein [Proteobacteria bacterium]|nr:carboxypeptidase regulatory-like domain-containing protein [Pseudomonadota bacterium]MCL2306943.1 carboxypeptidase regulatory-like domain-containing protein [Pseudomonadota bacterium]